MKKIPIASSTWWSKLKNNNYLWLVFILLIAAFYRFYKLETIPGEIFGDMVRNLEHTQAVRQGIFKPVYDADGGREGLFFFLTGFGSLFLGNTYINLKITAALISLLSVIGIYIFAKELFGAKVGLLAAFLMAISRWSVVFGRIGFRAVLAPLLTSLALTFLLKSGREKKAVNFLLAGFFLGVGLYSYTAFRFVIIFSFFLLFLNWLKTRNHKGFLLAIIAFFLVTLPFSSDYLKNPSFYNAHSGSMIFQEGIPGKIRPDWWPILKENIVNQSLMLYRCGDIVFRVNPTRAPHLDFLSAIFFTLGIVASLAGKNRRLGLFLLVGFIFFQLPSVLTINTPIDVPSATRSICIMPLVYGLAAYGIYSFYSFCRRYQRYAAAGIILFSLAVICQLNWQSYFVDYVDGLPNHNTPFGKIIAGEIDKAPPQAQIVVVGCCWGDWGQPEPGGITYSLKNKREVMFRDANTDLNSLNLKPPFYLVINPHLIPFIEQAQIKFGGLRRNYVSDYQQPIFTSLANF